MLLGRLPPIRKRSPLGTVMDLWNSGILKLISSYIAENSTSLSRSKK